MKRPSWGKTECDLRLQKGLIAAALAIATVVAYWPVGENGFVNFDDHAYLTRNRPVQQGISAQTVAWAFTTTNVDNWHPLTWLVHSLHWSLFGDNPRGHHFANLAWHVVSAVLLFWVLTNLRDKKYTQPETIWASALIAALFALHPLHVESVVWAAELKDILCGIFFWLSIGAYCFYVSRPGWGRYLLVAGSLTFGLLSKPMIVTLPLLLLLLDVWPLERFVGKSRTWQETLRRGGFLLFEKLPLFLLAAASAVITRVVQSAAAAMLGKLPLSWRLANAALSIGAYLRQTLWPSGLAVLYPYPRQLFADGGLFQPPVMVSIAIIIGCSAAAIRYRDRVPYLFVGWFWYLITLIPVLGIIQVGRQARADRYTYVPLVGIFLILAYAAVDVRRALPVRFRPYLAVPVVVWLSILMGLSWRQTTFWRNDHTLFVHTLAVTNHNATALQLYGTALLLANQPQAAIPYLKQAGEIDPDYYDACHNLAVAYDHARDGPSALRYYQRALELRPTSAQAVYDLIRIRAVSDESAVGNPSEALRLARDWHGRTRDDDPELLDLMGIAYYRFGNFRMAIEQATQAERLAYERHNATLARQIAGRLSIYRQADRQRP